jgi:AcrR family transcriptional regulator
MIKKSKLRTSVKKKATASRFVPPHHFAKTAEKAEPPSKVSSKRGPKVDIEQTIRRKREILQGAARLFDRVGYHGVNMAMIAESAGLKKPTLYHYISGKDEILFMLHELFIGTLRRNTDARLQQGADTMQVLYGVVEDTFSLIHDYPGYLRAFVEHFRELSAKQRGEIVVKRDAYVALIIGVIEQGMAEGTIRKADPRLVAHSVFGVCNWAYQWYRPSKDPAPEIIATKCWDIIRRGLAAS